jgi:signal transduction histidine kinase
MKTLGKEIRARPKTIALFIGAVVLPLIVVGALSFDAMSKRRASIDGLLEVSLLNTGRAIVAEIESEFEIRERAALGREFARVALAGEIPPTASPSKAPPFRTFSLDAGLAIIPLNPALSGGTATPAQSAPPIRGGERGSSLYDKLFADAERTELVAKDTGAAAESYRRAAHEAKTAGGAARALNGLARCLASRNEFGDARDLWLKIAADYGAAVDPARHPYGLTACLLSAEMDIRLERSDAAARALISLMAKLREGAWRLRPAAFAFFQREIEAILKKIFENRPHPDLETAYRDLASRSTPFVEEMAFVDMLESAVIPEIESRLGTTDIRGAVEPIRFSLVWKGADYLVSFRVSSTGGTASAVVPGIVIAPLSTPSLPPSTSPPASTVTAPLSTPVPPASPPGAPSDSIRGCLVASRPLVSSLLDRSLASASTRAEYRGQLVGPAFPAPPPAAPHVPAATFAFDRFPIPFKIALEATGPSSARRTALRENILLGILLAAVFGLMFLGGLLLARDVARESEIARQKTEFVHNISHELKTPLTLIRLFGETLERNPNLADADRREAYEIINRESERLSHLIDNVLDFSRIEMGRKEFVFADQDLGAIVRETMDAYRKEFAQAGFDVALHIEPGLPCLRLDREAITGVLLNFFSNALKFSPSVKSISVRLARSCPSVSLEVADRGAGISAEDLPRIFEKFYRGGKKAVAPTSGSGLGLTLAKYIVEAHGGRIEVESRLGEGSTFRIVLPVPIPAPRLERAEGESRDA